MDRKLASALAMGSVTAAAAIAVAAIASGKAFADDITIEDKPFVGSMSRDQVSAELKLPYPGGNPWAKSYDMFQLKSRVTGEQVRREYMSSRNEANALHAEDSGSASVLKSAVSLAANPAASMGGPAR